jgi:Fe-S-cluster containining protein
MNYSEFLIIVNRIYDKFAKEKRMEILKKSIKYFFSNSLVKPCPLLDGKKCSIYEVRPLSCRMFGLWPEDVYEERVQRFVKVSGLQKHEIPLNTQCKYVKRIDESQPLTKEVIEKMYDDLNGLDAGVGNFTKEQVEKRYNQRTWHDWFMVNVFGENNLSDLSRFFLAAEDQKVVDDFVIQMCKQVDLVGDQIFKRKK